MGGEGRPAVGGHGVEGRPTYRDHRDERRDRFDADRARVLDEIWMGAHARFIGPGSAARGRYSTRHSEVICGSADGKPDRTAERGTRARRTFWSGRVPNLNGDYRGTPWLWSYFRRSALVSPLLCWSCAGLSTRATG